LFQQLTEERGESRGKDGEPVLPAKPGPIGHQAQVEGGGGGEEGGAGQEHTRGHRHQAQADTPHVSTKGN